MRWFFFVVLIGLLTGGCSDSECSVDSDCGQGGICVEGGGVVFASRACVYDDQMSDLEEQDRDMGMDQSEDCVPRLNQELCQSISAECGVPEVEECGETVELSCGQCSLPRTCSDDFRCECVAESDEEFCDRFGAACGSLQNLDNCGQSRQVDCGECPNLEDCGKRADNVCGCPCEIEGECFSVGAQNPDNACEICDPSQNPSSWTSEPDQPCDDGNKCTVNDVCGDDGTCTGDAVQCVAGLCRTGSCEPETGACIERVRPDSCLIDGTCYDEGDRNPSNECEWCQAASPTSWVAATGQSCTDDGVVCTDDICDSSANCTHPIQADHCLINGTCYSDGERVNFNCCRGCDPSINQTRVSPINIGMACSAGCECSSDRGGSCVSGRELCIAEQCED